MTEQEPKSLHEVFYCSLLAPDLPANTVGAIVTRARVRNAEQDITGLLVFDGMRFCQHLEGPHDAIRELMGRITADDRHTDVRVVYENAVDSRRYSGFGLGLAESEGPDLMAGVHALNGEVAFRHFLALRASFDING